VKQLSGGFRTIETFVGLCSNVSCSGERVDGFTLNNEDDVKLVMDKD
jgi:hypothetical protein